VIVGAPSGHRLADAPHDGAGHNGRVGPSEPSSATPAFVVRVLGELEVDGPAGAIEIRAGLPRALLTMLVVRVGTVVAADVLIDELWADRAPTNPANALQVQVSYLRRQLRPLAAAVTITRDGSGYRLEIDTATIDAVRFEGAVDSIGAPGEQPATRQAALAELAVLDAALGWWRGEAYADGAHLPLVEAEHHRLQQRRVLAEHRRGELLDRLGQHADAVARLEVLASQHPFREDIRASLIGALYRSGRQTEALRSFSSVRAQLVDELGIEPGPELRRLERAVLDHDPVLAYEPLPDAPTHTEAARVLDAGTTAAHRQPTPLAVSGSGPGRLPAPIAGLIGRGWEIDEVRALLARNRLVTLTGPGGVGKTRLALEAVRNQTAPVTVVELGGITDPASLAGLLATALPVPTDPRTDPLEAAAARIDESEWLILLDTCEHMAEAVAAVATSLLARCPALRILATSRRPLRVGGEVLWRVPLLELPDPESARAVEVGAAASVRLFVERARAVSPAFELSDDNAAAVAAICRALDGLPLAIELAAARIGVLSPESLHERLRDRFAVLTRGPRDAAARQRSLQATVEWSFDQLEPHEQRFMLALGTFPGSFGLEAAAAVADIDELAALDILDVLVERSLVVADGNDRFRQLDTLREFSRSALERGDPSGRLRNAAQRRLAIWVRDLAVNCDPYSHGPLPMQWPRLREEAASIRETLDWAFGPDGDPRVGARTVGAIGGSLALAGDFADAARWLAEAQDADVDDETAATVLRGVAVIEMYQGRFGTALAAAERSHRHARATGVRPLWASCAITYGSAAWGVEQLARSEQLLREAAEDFDTVGDVRGRGFALARLARTLADLGDETAVNVASAAVDDLETADDDWVRVVALDHLAYALLVAGDHRAAAVRAAEAVRLGEQIGSHSGRLAALGLLGRIRWSAGELDEAMEIHTIAVQSAMQIHNLGAAADGLDGIADVLIAEQRDREAALALGAAEAVRRRAAVVGTSRRTAGPRTRIEHLTDRLGSSRLEQHLLDGAALAPPDIIALVHPA
jgi:predicted ATPase/DNA-binding SARP family transcriptional activator